MKTEFDPMKISTPEWDRFRGNNHTRLDPPKIRMGGSVSFKEHLGRPLSQRLWDDLIHRLEISGLCIYGIQDGQWTIGWFPGHCCIQLDGQGYVDDIDFVSYPQPKERERSDQPPVFGVSKISGYMNFPNKRTGAGE